LSAIPGNLVFLFFDPWLVAHLSQGEREPVFPSRMRLEILGSVAPDSPPASPSLSLYYFRIHLSWILVSFRSVSHGRDSPFFSTVIEARMRESSLLDFHLPSSAFLLFLLLLLISPSLKFGPWEGKAPSTLYLLTCLDRSRCPSPSLSSAFSTTGLAIKSRGRP